MFGWLKQKTEMQKLIERTGYEKSIEEVAALIGQRITTIRVFRQFILEELDAAQQGNAEAKAFVRSTGIPASEYNGAMSRSWPEVDGPDGPQQLLVQICMQLGDDAEYVARFRIAVVQKILSTTKPGVASAAGFKEPASPKASEVPKAPEIRSQADIDRLFREQDGDAAEKTIHNLAKAGNLACQKYLAAEAFGMLLGHKMGLGIMGGEEQRRATWAKCERYMRLAAEQGDVHSQSDLAELYFDAVDGADGYLNARDHELIQKAKFWHRKAAAQGFENSIAQLEKLEAFPDDAYENVLESNRRRQELRVKAPGKELDEDCLF